MRSIDKIKSRLRRSLPASFRAYDALKRTIRRGVYGAGSMVAFDGIIRSGLWLRASDESHSGGGSTMEQTAVIRAAIPALLNEIGARTALDVPCGDGNWMQHVNFGKVKYIGADLIPAMVDIARVRMPDCEFRVLNIINDPIPQVDVILCRDCLVHFSYEHIAMAVRNFVASGSRFLLTTTFTDRRKNANIATGGWRPINLQAAPFNFPAPIRIINEGCTEGDGGYADKSLALWDLTHLRLVDAFGTAMKTANDSGTAR